MPFLDRGGARLHYEEAGHGDPPLVFVHGWCCNLTHFAPQMAHFSARHRCVAVDQRGHGESDAPEQAYSIDGFAGDLAWLCEQLSLRKPVVIGHSLGGAVALRFAAGYQELSSAIVMLDGAVFFPEVALSRFAQTFDTYRSEQYIEPLRQFIGGMFLPGDDSPLRTEITDGMLRTPQHVMVAAMEGLIAYDTTRAESDAAALSVPAMYVGAAEPVAKMARVKELMPGAVRAQTAGAGHFHQLEVPEQINAMIERFLVINGLG